MNRVCPLSYVIQDERDTNPLKVTVKGCIQYISADPFMLPV